MKQLPDYDQLDKETVGRIMAAVFEADYQMSRVKRNLRRRIAETVTEYRARLIPSEPPPVKPKIKTPVDYKKLLAILQKQPITYDIIKRETGLNDNGVAQVITTLSLDYALWNPAKGIYELLR